MQPGRYAAEKSNARFAPQSGISNPTRSGFPWPAHFREKRTPQAVTQDRSSEGGSSIELDYSLPPKSRQSPLRESSNFAPGNERGPRGRGRARGRRQRGSSVQLKPLKRAFAKESIGKGAEVGSQSSGRAADMSGKGRGSRGRGRPRKKQTNVVQDDVDCWGGVRH